MADVGIETRATVWKGGQAPYAISSKKLGMWLFIVSDSLTFATLLVAYSYVRVSSENWPLPFEKHSIALASIMTFCLLSSSLTMVMAVSAAHRLERSKTVWWLLATVAGGLLFVILHTNEWLGLIHEGVTPFSNPWGSPLFGASFFTLTGLHMTHVVIGVGYLLVITLGFSKGKFSSEDVEISGLYWHFVDLVWMFVFPLVYLLSAKF